MFGHVPRGPLKLLKESWLADDAQESLVSKLSNVRDRLHTANELAQKHLKVTQGAMKTWYDRIEFFVVVTRYWYYCQFMGVPSMLSTVDHILLRRK